MGAKKRGWIKWVAGTLAGVCLLAAPLWGGPPVTPYDTDDHPWEGNPYGPPTSGGGHGIVIIVKGSGPWVGVPYFWNIAVIKTQGTSTRTASQSASGGKGSARVEKKAGR